ncbi:pyruvate ferredoxin oxidoreductase [Candidatus Bathyarchaeota archaeon]|nr:MAG: pyruvate ferredoxin oxidoreductase [Candidatus Bathyarchaeota archaeon ex4484_40]RJS68213.1 MAG: pyruvate ferredoxin oxidoreductase [Candidatus Bathyarchaeota archaeon]RLG96235.1 MAG: pyruvate ferredoxin oxidoreductase [Candidatus Bathyarchaeota archaeon]HDJ04394.1 pyruvate ferredoxin oxidoreductase [Candidatus Bathyarchaeota archaeon]
MGKIIGLTGDEAIAYAVKQCNVDVVAAYPITPQTIIVEAFSEYVHNGEVDTEFICVESEHSAMSACIGASLTGARVFTATASQGLALMHEMLYIASGLRCPIVMGVVNRALSAPINIHGDHSDMMGSRDCGWIQIYAENAQEAYDWVIQAFKIAEDHDVLLPVTVCIDAFILSHSMEGVEVREDEEVSKFLPVRKPSFKLDPDKPITVGALCLTDYYFEVKRQQVDAMERAPSVIKRVTKEYNALADRSYGLIETYNMEDADVAIMCLGSTAGTAKAVARKLRDEGKKVGVIKPWVYRPFPTEDVLEAVKDLKVLAVLDRACSFGAPYGALCSDVLSILYTEGSDLLVFNGVYGLGGRDITPFDVEAVFNEALEAAETGVVKERFKFIGVRE